MRYLRAELFFIIMVVLLCGAGLMLVMQHQLLNDIKLQDASVSLPDGPLGAAMLFLIAAGVAGSLMLLPHVRMQVKNKGQLKIITWMITRNSQDLEQIGFIDPLTGLQSRHYFDAALHEYLLQFGKINRPVTVLLIGIERLQLLCEQRGRDVTDRLLIEAALCIRNCTRYHDVLAHMGDGEFALIVPDLEMADADKMAARICKALEQNEMRMGHESYLISAASTVAEWNAKEKAPALYKRARAALLKKQSV
ncbi:GGDEF domain-containing protein [Pseudochrobactrum sp. sp1633]|uniref:GGDEF domain-containing protein n=1 Tax=Pseudochrobactrum sp. sp1633 TaxID=3036706 RepID=UPI0025A542B0|nr:GGDEF domain-containing protein [Pseudochrobactrum sp. sp1633]MDM8345416.1 GGDEF domain-containing protein [Pseudochrobactrum sp. sp1633]HWD13043.1 GGDEF domain-containing protein [Pseudochrobactrum sp.]